MLDLFAPALDGDHPLVVVVGLPERNVGAGLGADAAYSLTSGSEDSSGHGFMYRDLCRLLLSILIIYTSKCSSTKSSKLSSAS